MPESIQQQSLASLGQHVRTVIRSTAVNAQANWATGSTEF
jgi:hypothetical protein